MKNIISSAIMALVSLCLAAGVPAMAQNSLAAPPDWCVSTTFDFVPSGCNRATPDNPDRPITTAAAARRELVAQADALLKGGHVTAERYAAELKRISLTAPGAEQFKVWEFRTGKPGFYIKVTVDQPSLRAQP